MSAKGKGNKNNMKLFFRLWVFSLFLFLLSLIFFALFVMQFTRYYWLIVSLLLIAAGSVLISVSDKRLKLDGGYSVIEAMMFYSSAKKLGTDSPGKLVADPGIISALKEKYSFARDKDEKYIKRVFADGAYCYSQLINNK